MGSQPLAAWQNIGSPEREMNSRRSIVRCKSTCVRRRPTCVHHEPAGRPTSLSAVARAAVLAAIGITLFWPAAARTAELQLRRECRPRQAVVTLGDVAEVSAADSGRADALAAVELFPAPAPGTKRFLRLREIQDLLLIRGVNLIEHRLSGASQVVVLGPEGETEARDDRPVPVSKANGARRRIGEAVVRYLQQHVREAESWTVDLTLDDSHTRSVASSTGEISVRGGMPPWVGMQRFEITVNSSDGPVRFDVDAQVTVPPSAVVAARRLQRGALVRAADVQLQQSPAIDGPSDAFHSIDEVVGKQTTRTIPAGQTLDRSSVRQPLLVGRGDVITVYVRSAGIRVRTTARARDSGSLGELIQVESLLDRATYFARVSGIREVEVYAQAIQADRSRAADFGQSAHDDLGRSVTRR